MTIVFLKEFRYFFSSTTGYLILVLYLLSMGMLLWVFPEYSILESEYATLSNFFSFVPLVFLGLIPAITMSFFSEEKKSGTIALLSSSPLKDYDIVLGKYFSSLLFVLIILVFSLFYYWVLYYLASPIGFIDHVGIIGGFLGLALLGSFFCSVSLFFSIFGSSQVVCYIISCIACFFIYQGFFSLKDLFNWSPSSLWMLKICAKSHYENISKGIISTKDLGYFLFSTLFFLELTIFFFRGKK